MFFRTSPKSQETSRTALALASILLIRHDLDAAEGLFREALRRGADEPGLENVTSALKGGLASILLDKGQAKEAADLLRSAVELIDYSQEKNYSLLVSELYQLGNLQLQSGNTKEADSLWEKAEG